MVFICSRVLNFLIRPSGRKILSFFVVLRQFLHYFKVLRHIYFWFSTKIHKMDVHVTYFWILTLPSDKIFEILVTYFNWLTRGPKSVTYSCYIIAPPPYYNSWSSMSILSLKRCSECAKNIFWRRKNFLFIKKYVKMSSIFFIDYLAVRAKTIFAPFVWYTGYMIKPELIIEIILCQSL